MGTYSVVTAKHTSLSTTVQDTITMSGVFSSVTIINRAAAAGADIGFRVGFGTIPADITTVGEDDSNLVSAQGFVTIYPALSATRTNTTTVKVKGSANAYSVIGNP